MNTHLFSLIAPSFLKIEGQRPVFPVHRIFCVGQNYAAHVKELGGTIPLEPIFFTKPHDTIVHDGDSIPYPPMTKNLHHEVELVVALERGGANIPAASALDHIFGYAVGLDLTRRDLQQKAKEKGQPWDMGKGFDAATPCGVLKPAHSMTSTPFSGKIQLSVNGNLRQSGLLEDMIWQVPALISRLSEFITLKSGDILMTGTPAGVSPLNRGDKVDAYIENVGALSVTIV